MLVAASTHAGVLSKEDMVQAFPAPLIVGDKDPELPVWPLYQQVSSETPLVAYAFETIDFAPISGFAGVPFNLLVSLDPQGTFLNVRVLSHHEPVFLEGLGEQPLIDFAGQYSGLSLMQNIKINTHRSSLTPNPSSTYVDGITKATASVKIFHQSLLAASLQVAREKLGFAVGRDPDLIARLDREKFTTMTWDELLEADLIQHYRFTNADAERLFLGTPGEALDDEVFAAPEETFIEVFVANLSLPTVGRNLLHPRAWEYLVENTAVFDQVFLFLGRGYYSFVGDDFVRGGTPERLSLAQSELPIDFRDFDLSDRLDLFDLDYKVDLPEALQDLEWKAFHVLGQSGLDPAYPADFQLHTTRQKGIVFPEYITASLNLPHTLPADYYIAAETDQKTWVSLWKGRSTDIFILITGLIVLTVVLFKFRLLTKGQQHLKWFRPLFLLYTLIFIGWYAQGQLSIVNVTGVLQASLAGRSLEFFLYDPVTVILWAYVALTLLFWGRGPFCGWLCPFGAMQELLSKITSVLRIPQVQISQSLDARLKGVKYGLLLMILAVAAVSIPWTASVVEIEPFKTSITLMFDRSWPFVLWALAMLGLSVVLYKGYCRYVCPLGAWMALMGRLRIYDWLPRRAECGSPCRLCSKRCEQQAIPKSGVIDYNECFQCLDCVVIYDDDTKCVPLIIQNRNERKSKTGDVAA